LPWYIDFNSSIYGNHADNTFLFSLFQRRGINTFIALCLVVAVGSGAFVWTLGSTSSPYVGMSGTIYLALLSVG
jgi:membrane associated rhomboid family serine protease